MHGVDRRQRGARQAGEPDADGDGETGDPRGSMPTITAASRFWATPRIALPTRVR